MIGRLRGEVIDRALGTAVVDVHGVGYRVAIPEGSALRLGQPVDLHVYTHVREDALQLFAFEAALDLSVFELLLTVPGVGPVKAMGMLRTSVAELVELILAGDPGRLAKLPGVGKKTAERLVLDLREKLRDLGPIAAQGTPSTRPMPAADARARDLHSALINLGFREGTAEEAARRALERLGPEATLEALLKEALLSRRPLG